MKTTLKNRINNAREAFFANDNFPPAQITVREGNFNLQNQHGDDLGAASFNIWAITKILVFFVPGVSLLYFVTLILTELIVLQNENILNLTYSFFWLGLSAFLVMFGISKLAELKYLKVVASIFVATLAFASVFLFGPVDAQGVFFGGYSLYFLPIILSIAYLVKKWIDKDSIAGL